MKTYLQRFRRADVIIAILLTALSAWVYGYAGTLITEHSKPIAAHTFPRALAVLLAVGSGVLLVISWWEADPTVSPAQHRISGLPPTAFVLVMMLSLAVYALVLPVVGFIPSSLAAMALWLWLTGVRRYGIWIGFTVGVVLIVYVSFQYGLNVPLP